MSSRRSNFCAMCIEFMIPSTTLFNKRSSICPCGVSYEGSWRASKDDVQKTESRELSAARAFMSLHLHTPLPDVDLHHATWRPSGAILPALRATLCRIPQMDFSEFTFHALG